MRVFDSAKKGLSCSMQGLPDTVTTRRGNPFRDGTPSGRSRAWKLNKRRRSSPEQSEKIVRNSGPFWRTS